MSTVQRRNCLLLFPAAFSSTSSSSSFLHHKPPSRTFIFLLSLTQETLVAQLCFSSDVCIQLVHSFLKCLGMDPPWDCISINQSKRIISQFAGNTLIYTVKCHLTFFTSVYYSSLILGSFIALYQRDRTLSSLSKISHDSPRELKFCPAWKSLWPTVIKAVSDHTDFWEKVILWNKSV